MGIEIRVKRDVAQRLFLRLLQIFLPMLPRHQQLAIYTHVHNITKRETCSPYYFFGVKLTFPVAIPSSLLKMSRTSLSGIGDTFAFTPGIILPDVPSLQYLFWERENRRLNWERFFTAHVCDRKYKSQQLKEDNSPTWESENVIILIRCFFSRASGMKTWQSSVI